MTPALLPVLVTLIFCTGIPAQTQVKDGQCPNIMARCMMPLTYNCTIDSDCIGSKKCCPLCGRKCLDPKPAPSPAANLISVCPPFNSSVCIYAKPTRPECYNDSQCNDSKKCCCTTNCGLQCMVPEKVKDGQCPNIMAKCVLPLTYNCTSDSDCIGSKKCCPLCGTECLDPEPVTLMNCPKNEGDPSDSIQCGSVHCTRDADCKPQEKCCACGNGRSCVKV